MMVRSTIGILMVLVALPLVVHAQVEISEIMYDLEGSDAGREWIEVHNSSTSPIDLASWTFFENGTNHGLYAQTTSVVPADGYAVIADTSAAFSTDWPSFDGILFDSAFSLSNTGETLALRNTAGETVDSISYHNEVGAAGDGFSLHRVGNSFVARIPSPGSPIPAEESTTEEEMTEEEISSETTTGTTTTCTIEHPSISLSYPELVYTGMEASFTVDVRACDRFYQKGAYYWNMGDGTTYRFIDERADVTHTYEAPGRYVVVFEYALSMFDETPYEHRTKTITVREPVVTITAVEIDQEMVTVGVTNSGSQKIDLGNWILQSRVESFVIPPHTIILPETTVQFTSTATRFHPDRLYPLRLLLPDGSLAHHYRLQHVAHSSVPRRSVTAAVLPAVETQPVLPSIPTDENRPAWYIWPIFLTVLVLGALLLLRYTGSRMVTTEKRDVTIEPY